jgi:hypothetical protein
MARRAYDHLQPFVRFNHYLGMWRHEVKEELDELQTEQRMWDTPTTIEVMAHVPPSAYAVADLRQKYVFARIAHLEFELQQINNIQAKVDDRKCTACDGRGEVRYAVDYMETQTSRCEKCSGTGTRAVLVS